ncbi:MAG: molybdenum cofactor guanylyltransferase [Verrucomicrobiales bacterium]|nr:molybdenum cofactor guanylyltransferase [Verrucomicrobiales bacterium]
MNSPFAAAILAGGRSRRFGTDKAFHPIGDKPMWQHQLAKIEPLMPSEILISANARQCFGTEHRVIVDGHEDCGPLGALASCLQATKLGRLLVVAVDLPEIPMQFLAELAYAGGGTVAVHEDGMPEPLVAVYPAEILPLAEAQLAAGRLAMRDLVTIGMKEGLLQERRISKSEVVFFANLNENPGG